MIKQSAPSRPLEGSAETPRHDWIEVLLGAGALVVLLAACLLIVRPFISAALWGAMLCFSTWPLFDYLTSHLGGRRVLAALVMTVGLTAVLAAPIGVVGWRLAGEARVLVAQARDALQAGPPATPWLEDLPLVGPRLHNLRQQFSTEPPEQRRAQEGELLAPMRRWLVKAGRAVLSGVWQICLSLLLGFFFYCDGQWLGQRLSALCTRLAGESEGQRLLAVTQATMRGVVYGILGTALVHALVIALGLALTGVPAVFILALTTFLVAMIPFGPALVWLPASLWLFYQGEHGRALFLVLWSFTGNLLVDSFVRPLLISRGGGVPIVLVAIGVFGGAAAFGFIGIFLGPTLLAVGYGLFEDWTSQDAQDRAPAPLSGE